MQFLLQFYCMNLIAATRAEGGLVCSKKDRLRLIRMHVNFQQPNQFMKFTLSHLKKISFNHSKGGWKGQYKSVPYMLDLHHNPYLCRYQEGKDLQAGGE